ncbi:MAG: ATP-binding protein [Myxococcota bacterium]
MRLPRTLRRLPLSVRTKAIVAELLVVASVLGAGLSWICWREVTTNERMHAEEARLLATGVRGNLQRAMLNASPAELNAYLSAQAEDGSVLITEILDRHLRVLASSDPATVGEQRGFEIDPTQASKYVPRSMMYGRPAALRLDTLHNEPPCLTCHVHDADPLGYLAVAVWRDRLDEHNRDMIARFSLSAVAVLVSLLVMSWIVLTVLVVRPVRRLGASMAIATTESGPTAVNIDSHDELSVLADAFNTMLFRLADTHRQLEQSLAARLAQADRFVTLGELAAGLAHEIKNPLAGLSGALQVLGHDFPEHSDRRDVVAEMQRQIERLNRAMNNLLRYALPAATQPHPLQVNGVLEQVLTVLSAQKAVANISVVREFGASQAIDGDPLQLEQAFLNLCLNALQAMSEQGVLTLRTWDVPQGVVVEVRDTGVGIPADQVGRIFKPFYTSKTTGTGLGLALVARIVEEHRGAITVESELGRGSRFCVAFPPAGKVMRTDHA